MDHFDYKNGALYANYEAREGRIFGLKKSKLCFLSFNFIFEGFYYITYIIVNMFKTWINYLL